MQSTITVLGGGYVGLTTAAIFAASGFTVYLVEPQKDRLKSIRGGKSFFYEEGLDNLVGSTINSGSLTATDSYLQAIPVSDIVFSAVGTPDNPDGSSNLRYVFEAANEALKHLKDGAVYVQKSTVPVGTGKKVRKIFQQESKNIHYVSNPEFLREGTALLDSLWFDRVVVGGDNQKSLEQIIELYKQVQRCREQIAKIAVITGPSTNMSQEYITTSLESAELTKVTANAFLGLKISFANSIAKLADATNADITEVMKAVGSDRRIGQAFLNAGRGYGGGCFPKDISGLIASGLENGLELPIMEAAQSVNNSMPGYIIEKLREQLGSELAGKKVGVLGLSFKAGTSDVRKSPSVALANVLSKAGAIVLAYDPQAEEEAKPDLEQAVILNDTFEETVTDAQAVIVATDWPEFLTVMPEKYHELMAGKVFVDAMNRFSRQQIEKAGLIYIGVGK